MTTQTYHTSVLLQESLEALQLRPDGIYVDATFGGGGHSRAIMERLGPKGQLVAFDQDPDAWENRIEDSRFRLVRENFRYMPQFLDYMGSPKVNGILADLGVSSHQFDVATRGFSTRFDGPLDMRMDPRTKLTAAVIVNTYGEQQLLQIFQDYGELRNAKTLVKKIVTGRKAQEIKTIHHFKQLIDSCVKGNPNRYLAQVFQALRIEVNGEMQALRQFLEACPDALVRGGRMAIITFHSLEDRLVKTFIKQGSFEPVEKDEYGRPKVERSMKPKKDVLPSEEEQRRNPRSRSARLRIAEKL